MSDESDSRRTKTIAERAVSGVPLGIVVQRLITLIIALCEMLEKRGIDPDNLLEGMTFEETTESQPNKNERFGTT